MREKKYLARCKDPRQIPNKSEKVQQPIVQYFSNLKLKGYWNKPRYGRPKKKKSKSIIHIVSKFETYDEGTKPKGMFLNLKLNARFYSI